MTNSALKTLHLRPSHSLFARCLSILLSTAPCNDKGSHYVASALFGFISTTFFPIRSNTHFLESPPFPRRLGAFVALVSRVAIFLIVSKDLVVGGNAEVVILFDQQLYLRMR